MQITSRKVISLGGKVVIADFRCSPLPVYLSILVQSCVLVTHISQIRSSTLVDQSPASAWSSAERLSDVRQVNTSIPRLAGQAVPDAPQRSLGRIVHPARPQATDHDR
jgi:hypothetical protein